MCVMHIGYILYSILYQAYCMDTVLQCNCTVKTLGTKKMWSLYTGGIYTQVQSHGHYTPGDR